MKQKLKLLISLALPLILSSLIKNQYRPPGKAEKRIDKKQIMCYF